MVEAIKPFSEVRFVTKDGEQISATKQDGVVTVVGDKNGVRQMPLEDFRKYMSENLPNVNLENVPQKDTVNFKGKADDYVRSYKVEATSDKKWGVGIASAVLPGLGQAINGQWGKAIAFFLGTGALSGLSGALLGKDISALKNPKLFIAGSIASGVAALGLIIGSTVDAVKNAKSEVRVVDEEGLKNIKN